MWGRILKVLEQKVRQGVEVRVMYDGMCAFSRVPYRYPKQMEALPFFTQGGETRE